LRNVGIAATVLALDPVAMYRDALVNNRVDALVGWREAGGNLATQVGFPLQLPGAGGDRGIDGDATDVRTRPVGAGQAGSGHHSDGDDLGTGCPRAGVRRIGAGAVELDRHL